MTAINIVRTAPISEVGLPVTRAGVADILALSEALEDYGYNIVVQTGKEFAGFGRVTVRRADHGDQFADEGDWLRVSNAAFERDGGESVWHVGPTTEVVAYGDSYPAQPYTAADFAEQFTVADKADAAVLDQVSAVAAKVAQRRADIEAAAQPSMPVESELPGGGGIPLDVLNSLDASQIEGYLVARQNAGTVGDHDSLGN